MAGFAGVRRRRDRAPRGGIDAYRDRTPFIFVHKLVNASCILSWYVYAGGLVCVLNILYKSHKLSSLRCIPQARPTRRGRRALLKRRFGLCVSRSPRTHTAAPTPRGRRALRQRRGGRRELKWAAARARRNGRGTARTAASATAVAPTVIGARARRRRSRVRRRTAAPHAHRYRSRPPQSTVASRALRRCIAAAHPRGRAPG